VSDGAGANEWRVLAIDDDPGSLQRVRDLLQSEALPASGDSVEVVGETSFDAALGRLEQHRIDLVVLDIRLGDGPDADNEAGLRTRDAIHAVRFVPIVFYTGLPDYADDIANDPFVEVVTKGSDPDLLVASVDRLLASGVPRVQRALVGEMEDVIRNFMIDYVAPRWADVFEGPAGHANLAYILARRLSVALTGTELTRVIEDLGLPAPGDSTHPVRYYVVPPIATIPMTGDLHEFADADSSGSGPSWWVVLTPSCDFAQDKAEFALLARCGRLDQTQEFQDVAGNESASGRKRGALRDIVRNAAMRRHYLPAAFDIPDLVVDFQDLRTIPRTDLDPMTPMAALDSPFAEELQSRFATYFGRIGTPDLDWDAHVSAIQAGD
jgi:CheY-like chemotaxis protein